MLREFCTPPSSLMISCSTCLDASHCAEPVLGAGTPLVDYSRASHNPRLPEYTFVVFFLIAQRCGEAVSCDAQPVLQKPVMPAVTSRMISVTPVVFCGVAQAAWQCPL